MMTKYGKTALTVWNGGRRFFWQHPKGSRGAVLAGEVHGFMV
jgi:hypothetical protein